MSAWLQGHEFIDVEQIGSYRVSGALSIPTTNQRSALNDVTTTSLHRDREEAAAADDDDDEDDDNSNYGCTANCCAVRLSICCDDNDKQVRYLCLTNPHVHCCLYCLPATVCQSYLYVKGCQIEEEMSLTGLYLSTRDTRL